MKSIREILVLNKLAPEKLCRLTGMSEAQLNEALDKEEAGKLSDKQTAALLKATIETLGVRSSFFKKFARGKTKSSMQANLQWKYTGGKNEN
ncbi:MULTISPECIES: hypothetical protein [Enterococcus]|uniref:hypothetical protein n=1 Tax=Enterococcus asini TaxID=57732 RepID=UPI001E5191F5|nr:hypothetical protein [Enterococcus asini]MCD5030179.1 hypothetical protein [Enterococcus asini]